MLRRPQGRVAIALLALSALVGCHRPRGDVHPPLHRAPTSERDLRPLRTDDELSRRACDDPLAFLKWCRERYLATVRDYRCTFHIRERAADSSRVLGPEQEIAVRFREQPYSVDMRWIKNPIHATRVNYVAGRWRQGNREHALIYPSGLAGLLTPAGVKWDIHSPVVRAASRRPVDDFGFRRTLELIIEYCEKARSESSEEPLSLSGRGVKDAEVTARPAYELRCIGEADLDGRPCLVLLRLLPYSGPHGPYPDRMLLIYIDREWLVPTGCFAFADDQGKEPIGAYVTTSVEMNVGLTDEHF